jgi:hypothetical protein
VTRQEKHHGQSGNGDYEFFPDGGIPISGGAASKGVHGASAETPVGSPALEKLQGEEKQVFSEEIWTGKLRMIVPLRWFIAAQSGETFTFYSTC